MTTNEGFLPKEVCEKYNLSEWQEEEIKKHSRIYYIDFKRPFFSVTNRLMLTKGNHIHYRYEVNKSLGKGSFSNVYKCYDHKHGKDVAIKVLRDESRFIKQAALYEIPILEKLRGINHDNLIQVYKIFNHGNHICFSFPLLENNLYDELKANNFQGFGFIETRKFMKQILTGLEVLRQHRIIHCDLKPENIILTKDKSIKIIDFGSSCLCSRMSNFGFYLQSRYYRAPEVILGCNYNISIDMWSFACIAVEIYTGCPLLPAKNTKDLLLYQIQYMGLPPESMLNLGRFTKKYFKREAGWKLSSTKDYDEEICLPNSKNLSKLLEKQRSINFVDLIESILTWDYEKRPTPKDCLKHLFFRTSNVLHSVDM